MIAQLFVSEFYCFDIKMSIRCENQIFLLIYDHIILQSNLVYFRAGEFSWNQDKQHYNKQSFRKRERKARSETSPDFSPRNCIINDKFNPQMTTIRAFFPKIRALSFNFSKRAQQTSPSSNALEVSRQLDYTYS